MSERSTSGGPERGDLLDAPDRSLLDPAVLADLGAQLGDLDPLHAAVEAFLRDLPARCSAAEAAAGAGDRRSLHDTAHTLKSAAAMLGAALLRDVCASAERRAPVASLDELAALAGDLCRVGARTRDCYAAWLRDALSSSHGGAGR